ncbi:agamous-like mads-box protein agl1 [Phtheirospermum japonicum]|uniref:Agamous-like mads-box protein agl1 n=1 Tax=Phtheirospermum japonicum TaxID=374723 RepID=A0A830BSI2_9LAMI|nr:agamous-like mads-box protein agl1 [Phtheirospermum japonicum]
MGEAKLRSRGSRTLRIDKSPFANAEMDSSRRLTSFRCCAKPRLPLSSSPPVAGSMNMQTTVLGQLLTGTRKQVLIPQIPCPLLKLTLSFTSKRPTSCADKYETYRLQTDKFLERVLAVWPSKISGAQKAKLRRP